MSYTGLMARSTANITFDPKTREMARALCHEYGVSLAHVIRQLIRAQYNAVFPGGGPQEVPLQPQDRDRGARHIPKGPRATHAETDTSPPTR